MSKTDKSSREKTNSNPAQPDQIHFLASASLRINQMETSAEIADFVCRQVKTLVGPAYVAVTLLDENTQTFSLRAIQGFEDHKLVNLGLRLTRTDPRKMRVPVQDIPPEEVAAYTSGRLEVLEGGLYILLARKYPRVVCTALEQLFNIRFVYSMGFVHLGRHIGGVGILAGSQDIIESHRLIIESIVAHAAAVISRIYSEGLLRESTEKYRILLADSPDPIFSLTSCGRYTYANQALASAFDRSVENIIGKTLWDFFPREEADKRFAALQEAFSTGNQTIVEGPLPRKDVTLYYMTTLSPVKDAAGKVVSAIGSAKNITGHKQAEEALLASNRRFEDIAENALEWVWEVDSAGRYNYSSAVVETILGYRPEEIVGCYFYDLFHPDDREALKKAALAAFAQKQPFCQFENKNVHKNGAIVWLSTSGKPIIDDAGNLLGYRSVDTDITESRNNALKLLESRKKFQALVETTSDFVWEMNLNGVYTYCSPQMEKLWGLKPEEMLGKTPFDLLPIEDQAGAIEAFSSLSLSQSAFNNLELRSFDSTGSINYLEISGVPFFDLEGRHCGYRGITRDITRRKQAAEVLRQSEERYKLLFESVPFAINITRGTEIIYTNPSYLLYFGYSSLDELKALPPLALFTPEWRPRILENIHRRANNLPVPDSYEVECFRKDGTRFPVLMFLKKIQFMNGPATVGFILDITERKQAEASALEMEALKRINQAKSELLANVSHELRTPLASIKGFIETLIEQDVTWTSQQQLEFLHSADHEVDRLTFLIRDLLDMSSIDSGKMVLSKLPYPVSQILDSISGVLAVIAAKHQLQILGSADLPLVLADKVRIGQVITNLVENATKFSSAGSSIVIAVKSVNASVIFSVEDQGEGIPPEIVCNLFNSFYQVERAVSGKTRGTGLGLAICKGIVEAHEGKIWVESQPGRGSKFSFSIPVVPEHHRHE